MTLDLPPTGDPAEMDRYLDGECTPAETALWKAALSGDPELATVVRRREAFLGGLAQAGATAHRAAKGAVPPGLEARVRAAVAGATTTRSNRFDPLRYAAAAVLLLAVGAAILMSKPDTAGAVPEALLSAAEIARGADAAGSAAGCDDVETSPHAFPLVRDGELYVAMCEAGDAAGTRARLHRVEDGPVVGYVAVPDDEVDRDRTIGKTVLGDIVVYDLPFGRSRAYLAVERDFVKERGDCAACHNEERIGKRNPHLIELRRWN